MQRSMNVAGRSHTTQTPLGAASALPIARVSTTHVRHARLPLRAATEVALPAASVDDEPRTETVAKEPATASADPSANKGKQNKRSGQRKNYKKRTDAKDNGSSQQPEVDRALIKERSRLLLKGEAVGVTMSPTSADVAVCFKGVRPLLKALKGENHTLLFFPSTRAVKPEQPEAPSAQAEESQPQQQEKSAPTSEQKQQDKRAVARELDLALVAVPHFQKPEPEVTIRVGAKSKSEVISRTLTRALLRSSSVALCSAGPSAALVALLAAAQARRAIGAEQQLDLAFSLEYLRVPASEAAKPSNDEEQPAAAAAEAAAEDVEAGGDAAAPGAVKAAATTSVLQFSFYKRALPTPEVLVSDFAPTRSGPAMSQLLTSLISERREVDLLLDSRDALFAVQTLARVVRDSWLNSKASVGIFLTSLVQDSEDIPAAAEGGSGEAKGAAPVEPHFTARLQLRRIPGAPNLVPTSGDGRSSLLGPPVGTVKWDSPVGPLAGAMTREWYSAGIFSVWPQEGVCVARALRALWQAQQERAAAAAAEAQAATDGAAEAAPAPADSDPDSAATAASSPLFQIALIPELQEESLARNGGPSRSDRRNSTNANGRGSSSSGSSSARSVVMHLLEVSPLLGSTLRSEDGKVVPISGGEQMHRLVKAVVLRNKMYANRPGGKVLALRPVLDDGGALAMRFQYIDSAIVTSIPPPPPPGQEPAPQPPRVAAPAAATAVAPPPPPAEDDMELDGYATDDEYGLGAEAAVLVPQAAQAAAAAAAASAAAAAAASSRVAAAAGGGAAGGSSGSKKSPWVMFVSTNTSSMRLAMGIVAETCKPYDRRCPIWLKVKVRPDTIAAAALSVAMSQAQVQERGNVELLVVPVLERKRDEQNRPFNALTWQLIKQGPGAEPGAAAAAAAAAAGQQAAGPSPAAMAAAVAAAAKVRAQGDALIGGTRKLW